MTVSVDIIRYEHKNVWKVPSAALNFTLEDAYLTDAARAPGRVENAPQITSNGERFGLGTPPSENLGPCGSASAA